MYSLKFVLVGESSVGKSQLSLRFCKKKFATDSQTTVGIEFATREIKLNEFVIKAQIWDTAGQERFQSMTKAYYKDAVGAILVYDICNRKSFENMKSRWLPEIRENCHENVIIILVGNKLDLAETRRAVPLSEASDFAESEMLDFIETSAQFGSNVESAFRRIVVCVAKELPAIKQAIQSYNLPEGWIYNAQEKKYLNIWSGEVTTTKPDTPAVTGMCINSRKNTITEMNFRDSGLYDDLVNESKAPSPFPSPSSTNNQSRDTIKVSNKTKGSKKDSCLHCLII